MRSLSTQQVMKRRLQGEVSIQINSWEVTDISVHVKEEMRRTRQTCLDTKTRQRWPQLHPGSFFKRENQRKAKVCSTYVDIPPCFQSFFPPC